MPYDVRVIGSEDRDAAWRLGSLAFGYHAEPMPAGWGETPGQTSWGAYDSSGRLVGKAVDREQGQWFGGCLVPTSGVAGVAVAPELRGRGVARAVLTRLLAAARERGAVISTLFPTTAAPYRRLGWETVGSMRYTAWPGSVLASVRAPRDVDLRPAVESDVPAIHELYRDVARTANGLLERSGPNYSTEPSEVIASYDGLTVAVDRSDAVVGYAGWDRGPGYDASGKLTVYDLIGQTDDATTALLAMFGSWAGVAPTVVLRLSTPDPAGFLLPLGEARVESDQPWMLRVVDVVGAVAVRGWPAYLSGTVDLDLADEECPWNAGAYRLVLDGGKASLEPGGTGAVRLGARGLGAWYAGAASPAVLRRAGLLAGDPGADDLLVAATAGPPPALHNYF